MNENMEERLLDLLCKQAVYGLTDEERREMQELELTVESPADLRSLEMTAAAISLSAVGADEHLPDHLKSSILAEADKFFDVKRSADRPSTVSVHTETRSPIWNWLGWAVAAAACVALAANIYVTRTPGPLAGGPQPTPTVEIKLTPAQERERLIASEKDLARAEWTNADKSSATKVTGDVVWSDAKQAGFVRVTGLRANDPNKSTYQLWIVDETQDPKTPIDGGTFDINTDGEVIVPINAKLKAKNPKAFAITVEKPGGVVVSNNKAEALAPVKPNAS